MGGPTQKMCRTMPMTIILKEHGTFMAPYSGTTTRFIKTLGFCDEDTAVARSTKPSNKIIFEPIAQAAHVAIPSTLRSLHETSQLAPRFHRADHNRDRALDSRPHTSSTRSNAIDSRHVAGRRNSTASILPRSRQSQASGRIRCRTD